MIKNTFNKFCCKNFKNELVLTHFFKNQIFLRFVQRFRKHYYKAVDIRVFFIVIVTFLNYIFTELCKINDIKFLNLHASVYKFENIADTKLNN